MTGTVQYLGKEKEVLVFYDGKCKSVKPDDFINVPLQKCKHLIEKTENFVPTKETVKMLKRFDWKGTPSANGMLKGERLFIIGSGGSLKGFDFSRLDNEWTLVLNHSLRYYSDAKMLMFLDTTFRNECKTEIDNFKGIVFACFRADYDERFFHGKHLIKFPINRKIPQDDINLGLFNGELVGLTAINLGLVMGAKEIYLLGFDMNNESENYYFFEDEFKVKGRKHKGGKDEKVIKKFRKFEEHKDRIFNCSPISKIDVFDYKNIEEVLNGQ